MKIICLGDSNTYGYDPRGFGGGRFPADIRWTARLADRTGWEIENLGENGREIPHTAYALSILDDQLRIRRPFDGVCVMLGANDLLCGASPVAAAARMDTLLDRLAAFGAPLLVLVPPRFRMGDWVQNEALIAASAKLAEYCEALAWEKKLAFADAEAWDIPTAFDGVHFTEQGHIRFAEHAESVFRAAFCRE